MYESSRRVRREVLLRWGSTLSRILDWTADGEVVEALPIGEVAFKWHRESSAQYQIQSSVIEAGQEATNSTTSPRAVEVGTPFSAFSTARLRA